MKHNLSFYNIRLDLLRILAGIFVVAIHIVTGTVNSPTLFGTPPWWVVNSIDSVSRVAVPIFVLISGFLLLDNKRQYSVPTFLRKRFVKVGLPFVFWTLFYFFWHTVWHHAQFTPETIVQRFLAAYTYYHLYFLYIIVGLYLLTPVLWVYVHHASRLNQKYFLLLLFAFSIVTGVVHHIVPSIKLQLNAVTFFLPYLSYFLAGHVLAAMQISSKRRNILLFLFIGASVATALLNFWMMHTTQWYNEDLKITNWSRYFYEYFSPNVIIASLALFLLFLQLKERALFHKRRVQVAIKTLATTMFGVYLIHPVILEVLSRFLPSSPILSSLLIKIVVVFILSTIIVFLIGKIKYLNTILGFR